MIIIAMTLYLPQHIAFLTNRAWFYYHGDENAVAGVKSAIETAASTSTLLAEKVKETVNTVAGVDATMLGMGKEL